MDTEEWKDPMYEGYIEIDGAEGEGGGQVIRNSISLSALLAKPVHIFNVRAKRERPGLRAQHLTGLNFVGELYQATVNGNFIGSEDIAFAPQDFQGGTYTVDTKTAGSICLLIQISMPCLLFGASASKITYRGGTNAANAPQIDYLQMILHPIVAKMGVQYTLDTVRRGFFPNGGGEAVLTVQPLTEIAPLVLEEQGQVTHIWIKAHHSGKVPRKIAEAMVRAAEFHLQKRLPTKSGVVYKTDYETCQSGNGSGLTIQALTSTGCILCGSALGDAKTKPDISGRNAALEILAALQNGAVLDEYATDQVIIFMALARGHSRVRVGPLSLHAKTSIALASKLSGATFTVTPTTVAEKGHGKEDSYWIECDGIGYQNRHTLIP